MLGIPLGSLGIGISIWEPFQPPGPSGDLEDSGILQEDGIANFVLQEDDSSFILQED